MCSRHRSGTRIRMRLSRLTAGCLLDCNTAVTSHGFRENGNFERAWLAECELSDFDLAVRETGRQTGTDEQRGERIVWYDVQTVVTDDFGSASLVRITSERRTRSRAIARRSSPRPCREPRSPRSIGEPARIAPGDPASARASVSWRRYHRAQRACTRARCPDWCAAARAERHAVPASGEVGQPDDRHTGAGIVRQRVGKRSLTRP